MKDGAMKARVSPVLLGVSLVAVSSFSDRTHAAIVASDDFSSGTLSGGTGWINSWTPTATSPATPVVSSASELTAGSGNYLPVAPTSVTSNTTHAVSRQFSSVVASSPYTVRFDWRMDTALTNFNTFNDRVHIGGSAGNVNSDATFSWLVGVAGADNGATNVVPDGNWYVYDYTNNNGFSGSNLVDTGITLTTSVVYSFIVNVNPAARTYTVNISGSDSSSYTSGALDFRNQSSTPTNTLAFGSVTHATNDNTTFSIDNISIDGVPEPSSIALAGLLGAIGLIRRRRD